MGAIARESSRGWMGFSILWGLNIAYSLATLFYQSYQLQSTPDIQPDLYSGSDRL